MIGEISVKDLRVDQNGGTSLGCDHYFLRMSFVTQVRVCFGVQGKMRTGDDAKRGHVRCQVIKLVEDADKNRATSRIAKNLRPVGLAIGMQANARVAGFAPGIGVGHHHDLIAKQVI